MLDGARSKVPKPLSMRGTDFEPGNRLLFGVPRSSLEYDKLGVTEHHYYLEKIERWSIFRLVSGKS